MGRPASYPAWRRPSKPSSLGTQMMRRSHFACGSGVDWGRGRHPLRRPALLSPRSFSRGLSRWENLGLRRGSSAMRALPGPGRKLPPAIRTSNEERTFNRGRAPRIAFPIERRHPPSSRKPAPGRVGCQREANGNTPNCFKRSMGPLNRGNSSGTMPRRAGGSSMAPASGEEMVSEPVRTSRREAENRTRTVQASPSTSDIEPGTHSPAAASTSSSWCSWRASSSLPSRSRATAEIRAGRDSPAGVSATTPCRSICVDDAADLRKCHRVALGLKRCGLRGTPAPCE